MNPSAIDINYYNLPTQNNKSFVIDPIAGDTIMDLSSTHGEGSMMNCSFKKTHKPSTAINFLHPSIPLFCAGNAYEPREHFVRRSGVFLSRELFRVKCTKQLKWFQRKYTSTQFKGLQRALRDEPNRTAIPIECLVDPGHFEKNNKNVFKSMRQNVSKPTIMSRYLTDIPNSLLLDTITESCFQEFDDMKSEMNTRNCMTSLVGSNGQRFVVYTARSKVICAELMYPSNDNDRRRETFGFVEPHPRGDMLLDCKECGTIDVGFCVNELLHDTEDDEVIARTDYACFVLCIDLSNGGLHLKYEMRFDKLLMGVAANPESREQFVVVDEDLSVALIQNGRPVNSFQQEVGEGSLSWQNVIYGNLVQTAVVSNKYHVALCDFRENVAQAKTFFELPTEYLNRFEELSPVLCWNPLNGHQYFMSTNQTVILSDERYLKTPVMAINHYMRSPPRFALKYVRRSVSNQINDLLFTIGSYEDGEIVGLNFTSGNILMEDVVLKDDLQIPCKKQLKVDGPLMKFSKRDEWTKYVNDWKISVTEISQRLSCPLIGISLCTIEEDRNIILQENKAGDLFYQSFKYCPENDGQPPVNDYCYFPEEKLIEFKSDYKKRCESWLYDCFCLHHNTNHDQGMTEDCEESVCIKTKHFEKEVHDQVFIGKCRDLTCDQTMGPHEDTFGENMQSCDQNPSITDIYRINRETKCEESEVGNVVSREENFCTHAFTQNLWEKIEAVKLSNKIVSRASIACSPVAKQLQLFTKGEKFTKPLSKTLYTNWISENYVPLETFNQQGV